MVVLYNVRGVRKVNKVLKFPDRRAKILAEHINRVLDALGKLKGKEKKEKKDDGSSDES